jgi:hypothetical protein
MKHLIVATLFVAVVALSGTHARACYCGVGDVPKSFKRAHAVFLGSVIDIAPPKTTDPDAPLPGRFFTITFMVERSWKGLPLLSRVFVVLSAQGNYGCFAYPEVHKGERYLVFADAAYREGGEDPSWNIMTACNRTALVDFTLRRRDSDPFEDMKALDAITALPSFRLDFKPTLHWKPVLKYFLPRA